MAGYRFAIEQDLALEIKAKYNLRFFVETGTYKAETALWASQHFDHVWTVEVDELLYLNATNRIRNPRITFIHGDSRDELPGILEDLSAPALVYLDAHWLDRGRHQRPDDCPLIEELAAVHLCGVPHAVMIHDAHYIQGKDLPPFTVPDLFPALGEIGAALPGWNVSVRKDVVLCLP
jgi:hypothetical protein